MLGRFQISQISKSKHRAIPRSISLIPSPFGSFSIFSRNQKRNDNVSRMFLSTKKKQGDAQRIEEISSQFLERNTYSSHYSNKTQTYEAASSAVGFATTRASDLVQVLQGLSMVLAASLKTRPGQLNPLLMKHEPIFEKSKEELMMENQEEQEEMMSEEQYFQKMDEEHWKKEDQKKKNLEEDQGEAVVDHVDMTVNRIVSAKVDVEKIVDGNQEIAIENPSTIKREDIPSTPIGEIKQEETIPSTPKIEIKQEETITTTTTNYVRKERSVPSSPISRMAHFSGLGIRLAYGTATEAVKRTFVNTQQSTTSAFLTEANMERLVQTLCRMRGAALKLGQMISIQDETIIPPQFQKIIDRVRANADIMPKKQLDRVLERELGGADWKERLGVAEFNPIPIAAASIGQVHRATLKDGRQVAMKIQYPGVADSIDSDIINLRRLINMTNLLPKGAFLETSMTELGKELKVECDYLHEARNTERFRELLANNDDEFFVPKVVRELTTRHVLTTEMVRGMAVDELATTADQETRNRVSRSLLKLCLRELFDFHFMQTDPNWSNFFYDPETKRLSLIDFGACRPFPKKFIDEYLRLVRASGERDRQGVIDASIKLGFLTGEESQLMLDAHVEAAFVVGEPFSDRGKDQVLYDFKKENMTRKIHKFLPIMVKHRLRPPPSETYSLHRKLSGAFLLCFKLGAVIPCRDLLLETWENYSFEKN